MGTFFSTLAGLLYPGTRATTGGDSPLDLEGQSIERSNYGVKISDELRLALIGSHEYFSTALSSSAAARPTEALSNLRGIVDSRKVQLSIDDQLNTDRAIRDLHNFADATQAWIVLSEILTSDQIVRDPDTRKLGERTVGMLLSKLSALSKKEIGGWGSAMNPASGSPNRSLRHLFYVHKDELESFGVK